MQTLTANDLHELANSLPSNDAGTVERCIQFILADTKGHWHGRARAKMCRRLKHSAVTPAQSQQLVARITTRLATGDFSEQFYDQLRLAMHLDRKHVREVAQACLTRLSKDHVRKFSLWVLNHEE